MIKQILMIIFIILLAIISWIYGNIKEINARR